MKKGCIKVMMGNEACGEAALLAGCRFYGGYPITPATEILEFMSRRLPLVDGLCLQMEDEIAALVAVVGASWGGTKAMTATSGPGFSLMQEHIGFAAGAEIPCVIVDVMRGGPSTGLPTAPSQGDVLQSRWGTHGDHPIVVLAPASVREIYDLTVRAFSTADRYRTPVILLYDEVLAHLRERMEVPAPVEVVARTRPEARPYRPYAASPGDVAPLAAFGEGLRFHVTGLAHDARGYPTQDAAEIAAMHHRLHAKLDAHLPEIVRCEGWMLDDAEVAVVAIGIVARAAREAVRVARRQGIRAGLLRPITLWPFPGDAVREIARRVGSLVVAEMNLGQMILEVERAAAGAAEVRGVLRADGEPIMPEEILRALVAPVPATRR